MRGSRIPPEDIITYRRYIERSTLNMAAVLKRTAQLIRGQDDLLEPFDSSGHNHENVVLLEKIKSHLTKPALYDQNDSANFFTTS